MGSTTTVAKRHAEALTGERGRKAKRKADKAEAKAAKPKAPKDKSKYNNKSATEKREAKAAKAAKKAAAAAVHVDDGAAAPPAKKARKDAPPPLSVATTGGGAPPTPVQVPTSPTRAAVARAAATAAADGGEGAAAPKAEPAAATPAPLSLDNFRLSPKTVAVLKARGIEALFDIQAKTLHATLDGADVIGRARTGCGKTLAFVLPIVETLAIADAGLARKAHGRAPRVVVLAPTRELARQVAADFDGVGGAHGLSTLCLYGGAPYAPQEGGLRRGVDVVVGTPGRVKDHLERGTLVLTSLRFRVLDECDEMLNMGFVDDVEKILGAGGAANANVQTLLFSATLPSWVKSITARFLKKDAATVDLVGASKLKAAASVRHLVLPCHWTQRASVVIDVVRAYSNGGAAIVFTETKRDADELAGAVGEALGARALHGDVPQNAREATLRGFRDKKFRVLVATDVAARGLDISGVELVVQCEPPKVRGERGKEEGVARRAAPPNAHPIPLLHFLFSGPGNLHPPVGPHRARGRDGRLGDPGRPPQGRPHPLHRAPRGPHVRAGGRAPAAGHGGGGGRHGGGQAGESRRGRRSVVPQSRGDRRHRARRRGRRPGARARAAGRVRDDGRAVAADRARRLCHAPTVLHRRRARARLCVWHAAALAAGRDGRAD